MYLKNDKSGTSLKISVFKVLLLGLLIFFSFLMLRITLQYFPYKLDVGFLRIKLDYLSIQHWRIAFFIHVYTSMFTLFAGFTQFSPMLIRKSPAVHRILGYVYVFTILFITGPASFVMSLYANGGISSRVAFTSLSILWISFTWIALMKAKKGDYRGHQQYMMRSYALTLSALTLRAWKYGISNLFEFHPMDVYRFIAWAGWVFNLLVAEFIIWKMNKNGVIESSNPTDLL